MLKKTYVSGCTDCIYTDFTEDKTQIRHNVHFWVRLVKIFKSANSQCLVGFEKIDTFTLLVKECQLPKPPCKEHLNGTCEIFMYAKYSEWFDFLHIFL